MVKREQEIDEHAATELVLYIDNDPRLHAQWEAIVRNLWGHKNKGRYLASRAVDGFMHLVDAGARRYVDEFDARGTRIDTVFNRATRRSVAQDFVDSFERGARDEKRLNPASEQAATGALGAKQVIRVGKRCCKV